MVVLSGRVELCFAVGTVNVCYLWLLINPGLDH